MEYGASQESALAAQSMADQFMEVARKSVLQTGRTIHCSAGCNACCDELNYVELSEALLIVDELRKHPEAMAEVVQLTKAWFEKAQASGVLKVPFDDEDGNTPSVEFAFAYRKAKLPCPLLKNGLCRIYNIRPWNCRIYIAGSEPKWCEQLTPDGLNKRWIPQWHPKAISQIAAAQMQSAVESGKLLWFDYLGCHLARLLLGVECESAVAKLIEVQTPKEESASV